MIDLPAQRPDKMKLAVFFLADSNYHLAGWRDPSAYIDAGSNLQRWAEFAATLERGFLDMLSIADTIGVPGEGDPETLRFAAKTDKFEPFTLLSALSMITKNVGLVGTAATSFNPPYSLARTVASLDHLSRGRAGWNLVTGGNKEDALNFNLDTHVAHGERYDVAEEYIDIVRGLWDSFAEDAFPRDKASGIYLDPQRMKVLGHQGR